MVSSAEERVRKLARLPGNTACANCGQVRPTGWQTICIKFHTFVCNECKTSHQAISHRCKSISMSSWTDGEVDQLEAKGNDYCRATWLGQAPPVGQGGRPAKGMPIAVFKRFVVEAYEHKRYYTEHQTSFAVPAAPVAPPPPRAAPVAPPVAAPAPAADLLDFGAFSATPAPDFASPPSNNAFDADFATAAPTGNAAPAAAASHAFAAADFAATAQTGNTASTATASNNDFADFAAAAAPSSFAFVNNSANSSTVPTKKPIMASNSAASAAISSMENLSATTNRAGRSANGMMNSRAGMMGNSAMMGMGVPQGFGTMNQGMTGSFGNKMNGMSNGMAMNGMNNGMPMNGVYNGMPMNGMNNGMAMNGMNSGMPMSGMNSGMAMNGMSSSMPMNGMSNGMNHTTMNGGMMSNVGGTGSNGIMSPPMNYGGTMGGNAISGMTASIQKQSEKKKDAFSDLLPF